MEIYKRISLYIPKVKLIENNTLIFIDEIQRCPRARTALKFLAIDGKYDVIASGSLLGIHYNSSLDGNESEKDISIPVGYEREIMMYSLDFEEFLWANGVSEDAINSLRGYFDRKEKVPSNEEDGINEKYLKYLREYMVVGGMPEVVNCYLETHNFQKVYDTQQKIFSSYEDDIEQYMQRTRKSRKSRHATSPFPGSFSKNIPNSSTEPLRRPGVRKSTTTLWPGSRMWDLSFC